MKIIADVILKQSDDVLEEPNIVVIDVTRETLNRLLARVDESAPLFADTPDHSKARMVQYYSPFDVQWLFTKAPEDDDLDYIDDLVPFDELGYTASRLNPEDSLIEFFLDVKDLFVSSWADSCGVGFESSAIDIEELQRAFAAGVTYMFVGDGLKDYAEAINKKFPDAEYYPE